MSKKIIISGGGTGGHIFPAIAIANAFKNHFSNPEILFVGAQNRMEMQKVPAAGFPIIGLPIAGIQRSMTIKNLFFPFKLTMSLYKAWQILQNFKPDLVVGVGGYASGPLLWVASLLKIPIFIQEQNSFAGLTNKLLGKKAKAIFIAYEGMDQFFLSSKLFLFGNPVRQEIELVTSDKNEASIYFKTNPVQRTILCIGGSLGARTINESISESLDIIEKSGVQMIWQCGASYYQKAKSIVDAGKYQNIKLYDFIARMDLAYLVADLVISRAGAISISEICVLGKASILVPSPNVAEDHQTHNAQALAKNKAACLVPDNEAKSKLIPLALSISNNNELINELATNAKSMSKNDAANKIVAEIARQILNYNQKTQKH